MLRIVPHTVPRVGRSCEHFPGGFELHLLPQVVQLMSLPRRTHGGADVIRKEAWPVYRTSSGVRLCWELEQPEGPTGSHSMSLPATCGIAVPRLAKALARARTS